MRAKYRNPPINEVIVGAYFDQPIMPLHSEHVGLFWSQVRDTFPTIRQQPELAPPALNFSFQLGITDETYPMPRFWLSSEDGATVVQIQKNAFLLNWRKRADAYPHFDNVKGLFDKYFYLFSTFVRSELKIDTINIQTAELTYSNLIEHGSYWTGPLDTARVLPSFAILDVGAPATGAPDFNYLTSYQLAPDLKLQVSARTGRKAMNASESVLVFDLRAIGAMGTANTSQADQWYDRAHETIGSCFDAMTSPDIQRNYWERE
ncbi:MAG: TIGR04255 family protein [Alphaproteobacteria bacterium]|nr:TIGR04255 family protein [Alphaproteobacteria bacterium]